MFTLFFSWSSWPTFPHIFEKWLVGKVLAVGFSIFHLSIESRFSIWIQTKVLGNRRRTERGRVWPQVKNAAKVTLVTDFAFLSLLTTAESCFVVWPPCFKDSTQTHERVPCHFCHPKGWYLSYNGGKWVFLLQHLSKPVGCSTGTSSPLEVSEPTCWERLWKFMKQRRSLLAAALHSSAS